MRSTKDHPTEAFLADFRSPPPDQRPAPFWFWNHKLDQHELVRQIRHMRDSGYGGFVMHARFGLPDKYLGDAWYASTRTALEEARRLGLLAWYYDEDNWPSGTCSQRVTDDHPEFRMSSLRLAHRATFEPGQPPPELPACADPIAVVAVPRGHISGCHLAHAAPLPWKRIDAPCEIFVFERVPFSYMGRFPQQRWHYLDTLNPAAVREFIRRTHAQYATHIPATLHRAAQGWFTDEPTGNFNCGKDVLPWTPALPAAFRKRFGYDLLPWLPLLFAGGDRAARVRSDFFETCADLYSRAFYGTIQNYVRRQGHKFIGHMNVEGELHWGVRQQFDYFRNARLMDWGGVDSLFRMTWKREGCFTDNATGAKLAASAAKLYGLERVMSENCGGAGWSFAPRHVHWILGFLSACGVNYWIPHAYYYSIESYRKTEWPPSLAGHSTLSASMPALNDYAARLNVFMSGGRSVADVAVLYPNRAVWADLSTGQDWAWDRKNEGREPCERYETDLTQLTETLLRIHFDFDFLPEEALDKARITDGALTVRGAKGVKTETYRVIILPNCRMIRQETADRLRAFMRAGGLVLVVGVAPQLIAHTDGTVGEQCWNASVPAVEAEPLRRLLEPVSRASTRITGRGADFVIARRYRREDHAHFLMANTDLDAAADVSIELPVSGQPFKLDPETGAVEQLPPEELTATGKRGRILHAILEPGATLLIAVGEPAPRRLAKSAPPAAAGETALTLPDAWRVKARDDNFLVLDTFRIRHDMTHAGIVPILRTTSSTTFMNDGYRGAAWLILDGVFSSEQGMDKPCPLAQCRLNGRELDLTKSTPGARLDLFARELEVTEFLVKGENRLEFESVILNHDPFQPPVCLYLAGPFGVDARGRLTRPTATIRSGTKWERFGFPRYAGALTYTRTFAFVPRRGERYTVDLGDVRETARVLVNGTDCGIRRWPPYRLDVTAALKRGRNKIAIEVTNTMATRFNGGTTSGLLGPVRLVRIPAGFHGIVPRVSRTNREAAAR